MKVRVRLFATLRDVVGTDRLELDIAAPATADDAWRCLVEQHPALDKRRPSLTAAVNRQYVDWHEAIADGDEIAFIPPVSGG